MRLSACAWIWAALTITIAPHSAAGQADPPPRAVVGDFRVEEASWGRRRLIHDDVLWASQFSEKYLHPLDSMIPLGSFSPWEAVLLDGSLAAWDPRQEPLTYLHRSGPVGAVFHELRTRKGGTDAKAPVGMVGLLGGEAAAYALKGQKLTFYDTRPELKALVADTDRHFTYVTDARARGAVIDFRMGNVRKNLTEDVDQKYAVLFVELIDTGFDPEDRLTREAVKLYMSRVTQDGIVALHISNKVFRLEPVVAAIAQDLKLAGRVWDDDNDPRLPGKTASSWVVLANDEKALGVLAKPLVDQLLAFETTNPTLIRLLATHGPHARATEVLHKEFPGDDRAVEEFHRRHGPDAAALLGAVRRAASEKRDPTLLALAAEVYGPLFRPLKAEAGIGVRLDGDTKWPPAVINEPPAIKRLKEIFNLR